MTYETSILQDDRKLITVYELTLDFCANTYGVAPCTASGAVGSECYNTWNTCQDLPNYIKTDKIYRFYQPVSNWPVGEIGYPCIDGSPTFTATEIDPKGSLGRRGTVSVKFNDFADDDIFTDPYVSTRLYNPEHQGTFFGKLKRRNLYFKSRMMRVKQGYINDNFSFNDFSERLYVIDTLDFNTNGSINLTGKDLLKLTDDKRSVAPLANTGTLSIAYAVGGTSLELQVGEGVDYNSSGKVVLGRNVLSYTGISTDTLTGVVGGQNGSTDKDAKVDDSVQQCLEYSSINVVDIISGLLKTYAGVDESYIPYDAGLAAPTGINDEWDDEKANWLGSNNLTHLVIKPTGVNKLIENICRQNLIYIWFDERAQKVKLKAIAPSIKNETPITLTDNSNIVQGSITVKDNIQNRISQVWVHYDIIDITKSRKEAENYRKLKIQVDGDSENVNASGEVSRLVIFADWLDSSNSGLIITLAGRLLSRYAKDPKIASFKLDTKDAAVWTGKTIILDSAMLQGADGANELHSMQVIKINDKHDEQILEVKADAWDFGFDRYAFIAPDTIGDYTAESTENQDAYGFISLDDGKYTNGDIGHLIA